MDTYYSSEKNTQILIALLKAHGIKKIVASPGATNVCLVAGLQSDPYFEMYSSVDERSAAYIACGMAAESGQPVVLSCTGATASRNYIPGLTEAYYRKLPVLAVTSTQHLGRIGHHIPQVIDRRNLLNDIYVFNAEIPTIHDVEDEWAYGAMINKAIIALTDHGGGPVHIDLTTTYSKDFSVKKLPKIQVINKFGVEDKFPELKADRVGIFAGAHGAWSERLTQAVDEFCEKYNAVVFCDHTSNYSGKYRSVFNLVANQNHYVSQNKSMDLLIHIGEVSGAYMDLRPLQVWRVNRDGESRDTFRKLRYTFQMSEEFFFENYNKKKNVINTEYYNACTEEYDRLLKKIPELPFSNAWIAKTLCTKLPENSALHLGILNSLRSWNFFEISKSISGYANTGGFGIDGSASTLIGASLASPGKLFFCVLGDLAFFYDLNSIGNRYVGNNLRILVINNGIGTEFKNYSHPAARFAEDADLYMAAGGHYGNKSATLLRDYTKALGFEYLSASNKEEFADVVEKFVAPDIGDKPVFLEVFTDSQDESDALKTLNNLEISGVNKAKHMAKEILGEKGVATLKKIIGG